MADENSNSMETLKLTVNGQAVELPISKVLEHAQKHLAGEDSLQKAAEVRKENQKAIEAYEHLRASADQQDPQSLVKALVLGGFDRAQAEAAFLQQPNQAPTETRRNQAPTRDFEDSPAIDPNQIVEAVVQRLTSGEVGQKLNMLTQDFQGRQAARDALVRRKNIEEGLTKNPLTAKLWAESDESRRAVILQLAESKVAQRATEFPRGSDRLLPAALSDVATALTALGVGKTQEAPTSPFLGLGASSNGTGVPVSPDVIGYMNDTKEEVPGSDPFTTKSFMKTLFAKVKERAAQE